MIKRFIKAYENWLFREQLRKAVILLDKTAEYYFIELNKRQDERKGDINLPPFTQRENLRKLAYDMALNELKKVVAECRIDKCYKNCVKKGLVNA